MGVLHSFSIKNIFYDKMELRLFYFDVAIYGMGDGEEDGAIYKVYIWYGRR